MPIGFATMAVRSAAKAPTRRARIIGFLFCAAVVPFLLSELFGVRGHGFMPTPDGPTLLHGHTLRFGLPAVVLLFLAFLLGTPVFVVMAGYAVLPFFFPPPPLPPGPAGKVLLVALPPLPAHPPPPAPGVRLRRGG